MRRAIVAMLILLLPAQADAVELQSTIRAIGWADAVEVYRESDPDFLSTCYRVKARFLRFIDEDPR